jgi:hypothetical protein
MSHGDLLSSGRGCNEDIQTEVNLSLLKVDLRLALKKFSFCNHILTKLFKVLSGDRNAGEQLRLATGTKAGFGSLTANSEFGRSPSLRSLPKLYSCEQ